MKKSIVLLISAVLHLSQISAQNLHVDGAFLGQQVHADVDHLLAAEYFNHSIEGTLYNSRLKSSLHEELTKIGGNPLSEKSLAYLSKRVSVDFATLYFARQMYAKPRNKEATDLFQNYFAQQKTGKLFTEKQQAQEYMYVFVPGLFYKRHPETGGDFAAQRKLFQQLGMQTHLVETNEIGTVEENAVIIRKELNRLSRQHKKIVVVSASKGGPDVAYALGKLMTKEETSTVKAWISIGGVLRGSLIADEHISGFKRWFTKTILLFIGGDIDFVEDLSRERSLPRHNSLRLPEDLLIIHYVGAPLFGQVSQEVKKNFETLSAHGPNDGLTTLTDELTEQGIVITELGMDHYYRHPEIDKKSVALMKTVVHLLEKENLAHNRFPRLK